MTASHHYYERHVFFCLKDRANGAQSCGQHGALAAYERCKERVKAAGLSAPGQVRVNQTSCLNRCAGGPVAVVYPEGTWYTFVDTTDVDEIVDAHLREGRVVERLVLPAATGREEVVS